jgi:hypothetical protein
MRAEVLYTSSAGVNTAVKIEASDIFFVIGTITTVPTSAGGTAGTITITPFYGTPVTLAVAATTAITVDRVGGQTIDNLAVGQKVEASYKTSGGVNTAVKIEAFNPIFRVAGTITTVPTSTGGTPGNITITTSAGQAVIIAVVTATTITVDRVAGQTIANLAVGMRAEATYKVLAGVNTAIRIEASDIFFVRGTLSTVTSTGGGAGSIVVTQANGNTVTVNVDATASITVDRVAGQTIDNLLTGMRAEVLYKVTATGNLALKIEASDLFHVRGTITTVTPSAAGDGTGSIIVTLADGTTVTINIDTTTAITVDRVAGQTIANLVANQRAEVRYKLTSTGNLALKIEACSP